MRTYVDVACMSCREMWSVYVDKLDPLGNWRCYKCCGDRKAPETPKAGGCHDPRRTADTRPARTSPSPDDQMLADMSLQLDEAKQKLAMWQKKALAIQEELNAFKASRNFWHYCWEGVYLLLIEARLSKWARFKRWAKKQWEAEI